MSMEVSELSCCSATGCYDEGAVPMQHLAQFKKGQKECLISEGWGEGRGAPSPSYHCLVHRHRIKDGGRAEPS